VKKEKEKESEVWEESWKDWDESDKEWALRETGYERDVVFLSKSEFAELNGLLEKAKKKMKMEELDGGVMGEVDNVVFKFLEEKMKEKARAQGMPLSHFGKVLYLEMSALQVSFFLILLFIPPPPLPLSPLFLLSSPSSSSSSSSFSSTSSSPLPSFLPFFLLYCPGLAYGLGR